MEKVLQANGTTKQACVVAILISNKTDPQTKPSQKRDRGSLHVDQVQQEEITILNTYATNPGSSNFI